MKQFLVNMLNDIWFCYNMFCSDTLSDELREKTIPEAHISVEIYVFCSKILIRKKGCNSVVEVMYLFMLKMLIFS
jgi:hypothetical protein